MVKTGLVRRCTSFSCFIPQPDISKAKIHLQWEPVIDLRDGLARMVDDFKTRLVRLGEKVVV